MATRILEALLSVHLVNEVMNEIYIVFIQAQQWMRKDEKAIEAQLTQEYE